MTPEQAKLLLRHQIPLVYHPEFRFPVGHKHVAIPEEAIQDAGLRHADMIAHGWCYGIEHEVWDPSGCMIKAYEVDKEAMEKFSHLSWREYEKLRKTQRNGMEIGG